MMMLLSGNGEAPDGQKLAQVMSLLGVNNGDSASAFPDISKISQLMQGGLTVDKLLPLFAGMMNGGKNFANTRRPSPEKEENLSEKAQKNSAEDDTSTPNYLRPITDIAGDDINYALSHYFANS